MRHVLAGGARYALEQGYGVERDVLRCEDQGAAADADPGQVSARVMDRGLHQVGSLGSGNHFLEVQAVDEVYDAATAQRFGLTRRRSGPRSPLRPGRRSVSVRDQRCSQKPRACATKDPGAAMAALDAEIARLMCLRGRRGRCSLPGAPGPPWAALWSWPPR
jgi:tRNA-splicing ligase RtcB (3'-phosphate/5'-hydroxy nucleic acid ligase)